MRGFVVLVLSLLILASCSEDNEKRFSKLAPSTTGIAFSNNIKEDAQNNLINYLYFYNGAGVAAGDINNDGLIDLYFASNQQSNKLYLNNGDFKFEDITNSAGVGGKGDWTTGVTMADVNADGWLDIYVCYVHGYNGYEGQNLLFVNNQDATFTESSKEFGLDIQSYATQSSFFDYDNDGDLDMFLLNHSVHNKGTYGPSEVRETSDLDAGDRLFRNENGRFIDVTVEAGIFSSKLGYGLDVTTADINHDGFTDLFISNDFHENDYIYLNQGDGTFREKLVEMTGHTSRFSMGNDVADVNNDGLNDFAVLDMLPVDEAILKTSMGAESWDIYDLKIRYGYHHQVSRNTLQINQGNNLFSDVALMSNVYATDWSWSCLLTDLDMDGSKDMFISNGIYRRPNDSDYISYLSNQEVQEALAEGSEAENVSISARMPSVRIPNYAFRKDPDSFQFADSTAAWGLDDAGFSHGAVYADLDNDGDPDLVVNNVNEPAFVYRNNTNSLNPENQFLKIRFQGPSRNPFGVGAKCTFYHNDRSWYFENYNSRGFYSSTSPGILAGLGNIGIIDSIRIAWPGGRQQVLYNISVNQEITVLIDDSGPGQSVTASKNSSGSRWRYIDVGFDFDHVENSYVDFDVEPLMPHKLSTQGPALAKADIDQNGYEDIFIGGAMDSPSAIFTHDENGFKKLALPGIINEAVDAEFFDADADGDLDLYVAFGGNELYRSQEYQDLLLLNNNLKFTPSHNALPIILNNSSCVEANDYDADGDIDLFVGSRSIPGQYGISPLSFLLLNNGNGLFDLASEDLFNRELGMVTDAVWTDVDGDDIKELLVVGEWMSIKVLKFKEGRFTDISDESFDAENAGWWNHINTADIDQDGDMDIVAGNWGLNTVVKTSIDKPAELFVNDFDDNGSTEPIITFYKGAESYPVISRDELIGQIAEMKKKFVNYSDFAAVQVTDLFSKEKIESATHKRLSTLASTVFINDGTGHFTGIPLPEAAQTSPVFASEILDLNADGIPDLILMGNFYGSKPYFGRYDASYGTLLAGNGDGTFDTINNQEEGLYIRGEVRATQIIEHKDRRWLIIARNNLPAQVIEF